MKEVSSVCNASSSSSNASWRMRSTRRASVSSSTTWVSCAAALLDTLSVPRKLQKRIGAMWRKAYRASSCSCSRAFNRPISRSRLMICCLSCWTRRPSASSGGSWSVLPHASCRKEPTSVRLTALPWASIARLSKCSISVRVSMCLRRQGLALDPAYAIVATSGQRPPSSQDVSMLVTVATLLLREVPSMTCKRHSDTLHMPCSPTGTISHGTRYRQLPGCPPRHGARTHLALSLRPHARSSPRQPAVSPLRDQPPAACGWGRSRVKTVGTKTEEGRASTSRRSRQPRVGYLVPVGCSGHPHQALVAAPGSPVVDPLHAWGGLAMQVD